jgi:hypothetical protein
VRSRARSSPFRDRLFFAASVRGDQNSGLISDFILYPAANVSWVVSEEPFFPELDFLSNLRFRAAYGESGLRPTFGQARRSSPARRCRSAGATCSPR